MGLRGATGTYPGKDVQLRLRSRAIRWNGAEIRANMTVLVKGNVVLSRLTSAVNAERLLLASLNNESVPHAFGSKHALVALRPLRRSFATNREA